ncbi:mucin-2-like [Cottoperca gobio]|uniref:Mucin-2-like n=1 Tax=Cottoperca gobio TaxID=56716 RepID=A0A6J2PV01_COTGO|nr:mucin-2-like [Cottoperca gobio]
MPPPAVRRVNDRASRSTCEEDGRHDGRTISVINVQARQVHNHVSSICSTWGREHFKTFDGDVFQFPGMCEYNLASDCHEFYQEFSVHMKRTVKDGNPTVSHVVVTINDFLFFLSNDKVTVNDIPVKLPYYNAGVQVERNAVNIKLQSKVGLTVMWNGDDAVMVELDTDYANRTCGLCGDFNGVPVHNELIHNGRKISPIEFGNKQKVHRPNDVCEDPNEEEEEESLEAVLESCKEFQTTCTQLLRSEPWSSCTNLINPEPYIRACVQDMCGCANNTNHFCVCSTLSEFSRQCSHAGGQPPNWRTPQFCAKKCPFNMVYEESGSPCMDTCTLLDTSSLCEDHKIDGCYCPPGTVFDDISMRGCVAQSECQCKHNKIFNSGEVYRQDTKECTCVEGRWACTSLQTPSTCALEEGSHLTTFDGKTYTFHGDCYYTLAKDHASPKFTILVQLVPCANQEFDTCLKSVKILLNNDRNNVLMFTSDGTVKQNMQPISLPYHSGDVNIFHASSFHIMLQTSFGLQIQIQHVPVMQVYVSLEQSYRAKTRGLCGNYNMVLSDDMKTPQGIVEGTSATFSNSWKANYMCRDREERLEDPCSLSVENERYAKHWCALLLSPDSSFAQCRSVVDPEMYYKRCTYASCNCEKSEDCLCAVFSSYARACASKGVFLTDWRENVCDKYTRSCPSSQIFSYKHQRCQLTCRSLGTMQQSCTSDFLPVDGCSCSEGLYLNENGICVPMEKCPCYHNEVYIKSGKSINIKDEHCVCTNGILHCHSWRARSSTCSGPKQFFNCSAAATGEMGLHCARTCLNLNSDDCASTECESGCRCPAGLLEDGKGSCVKEKECPCKHDGRTYAPGSQISEQCNLCTCQSGSWECTEKKCPKTCTIYGSGHYNTFDQRTYGFQGHCAYVAVKNKCGNKTVLHNFGVITENVPCGSTGTTCSKTIRIQLGRKEIKLSKGKYEVSSLELGAEIQYTIRKVGLYLVIESAIGLSVLWDGKTTVRIILEPQHSGELCGLCGDFDGDGQNDFTTQGQLVVSNPIEFANSWKVSNQCPDVDVKADPCGARPNRHPWSKMMCSIITGNTFKECHTKVDPLPFYDNCVKDSCACDSGGDCECFCSAVAAYAQACNDASVCVAWRTPEICPVFCDYYNKPGECKWHYNPCHKPCYKTCLSPNETCSKPLPNLEGCYPVCPEDKPIFDEDTGMCVEECQGCFFNNTRYEENDVIFNTPSTTTPTEPTTTTTTEEPTTTPPTEPPTTTTEEPTTTTQSTTPATQSTTPCIPTCEWSEWYDIRVCCEICTPVNSSTTPPATTPPTKPTITTTTTTTTTKEPTETTQSTTTPTEPPTTTTKEPTTTTQSTTTPTVPTTTTTKEPTTTTQSTTTPTEPPTTTPTKEPTTTTPSTTTPTVPTATTTKETIGTTTLGTTPTEPTTTTTEEPTTTPPTEPPTTTTKEPTSEPTTIPPTEPPTTTTTTTTKEPTTTTPPTEPTTTTTEEPTTTTQSTTEPPTTTTTTTTTTEEPTTTPPTEPPTTTTKERTTTIATTTPEEPTTTTQSTTTTEEPTTTPPTEPPTKPTTTPPTTEEPTTTTQSTTTTEEPTITTQATTPATGTTTETLVTGPTLAPSVPSTTELVVPTTTECICVFNGTHYRPGAVIFDMQHIGAGMCLTMICSNICEFQNTSVLCSTTTVPTVTPPPPIPTCPEWNVTQNETFFICNCTMAKCIENNTIEIVSYNCPPLENITCSNGKEPVIVTDDVTCCRHYVCDCVCEGWGDPHYITFDGLFYSYQGNCTYVLMEEKVPNHKLNIYIDNVLCDPTEDVSCPRSIIISYKSKVVTLINHNLLGEAQLEAVINGARLKLPYSQHGIKIVETGINLILEIRLLEVVITFGITGFSVTLPYKKFGSNTQGHCGTCNNNQADDCMLPGGQLVPNCAVMADHWLAKHIYQPNCNIPSVVPTNKPEPPPTSTPCKPDSICHLLKSRLFAACHPFVSPENFYQGCVYDSCHVSNPVVECTSLQTYAAACAQAGVCLHWRNHTTLCASNCPSNKVYKPCGPAEQPTCEDKSNEPTMNYTTEGCFCPDGMKLFNKDSAICVEKCGCLDPEGNPREFNEKFEYKCQNCICDESTKTVICKPKVCSTPPVTNCTGPGLVLVSQTDPSDSCCSIFVCQCHINTCPAIDMNCPVGYLPVVGVPEGKCCPKRKCEAKRVCVYKGSEYQHGSAVPAPPCQECVCINEVDPFSGLLKIQCEFQKCDKNCDLGYKFVEANSDECCGKCVQTHCVVHLNDTKELLQPGDTWSPPENKCQYYTCINVADTLTTFSSQIVCPPFQQNNCQPGTVQTAANGCCTLCVEREKACKTVAMKTLVSHKGCQAYQEVDMPYCEGSCNTFTMYSKEAAAMQHSCSCCRETRSSNRTVDLHCLNGDVVPYSYIHVEECGCGHTECTRPASQHARRRRSFTLV